MTVGQRIKELRESKGISVIELANALNVSRATIYRYESNEIEKLPIDILEPIAKVLNVDPSILMGWDKLPGDNNASLQDIEKALELYKLYSSAIPQVQSAVEALLKPEKPVP